MITVTRSNTISLSAWWALALSLFIYGTAAAQQDSEPAKLYSITELEELVGPVALYPDDLLAIILPASSYPLQLVQAKRYLKDHEQDPDLEPSDEWDDAVVALLNYSEIVDFMNEDLDWTWTLGEAVVNQQPETMDAIQNFRERAYAAGNLKSDDHQIVSQVDGVIKIERAEPEVIYVPYYEPERVVIYQSVPAYHYYPFARPVYYYPYPAYYPFTSGFFWGVTTAYVFGWLTDGLYAHHYGHVSHPYYGHTYHLNYYSRQHVYNHRDRYAYGGYYTNHGRMWRAGYRHGGRPRQIDAHRTYAPRRTQRTVASNFSDPRLRRQTFVRRTSETIRAPDKRTPNRRTTRLSRDRIVARADHRRTVRRAASARSDTRVGIVNRSGNESRSVRQRDNREGRRLRTPVNRSVTAGSGDHAPQDRFVRTSRRSGQNVDPSRTTRRAADTNRQRLAVNTQKPVDRSDRSRSQRTPAPERTGQARQPRGVKSAPSTRQSSRSQPNRLDRPSNIRNSGGGNRGRAKGHNGRG